MTEAAPDLSDIGVLVLAMEKLGYTVRIRGKNVVLTQRAGEQQP